MIDVSIVLRLLMLLLFQSIFFYADAQTAEEIINSPRESGTFLPDFSFAGYHFGEKDISMAPNASVIQAIDYGVLPNDNLDDSKALLKVLEKANSIEGPVKIQLPAGRIILSSILYIERSNLVISGAGTGKKGTEIYIPRPMMYLENPADLKELREYLKELNKIQKEKVNNIRIPFSQYSWSGGMLWAKVPGARIKSYLKKYDKPAMVLANIAEAEQGAFSFKVDNAAKLKVGDVVEMQWFNKTGEKSPLITKLYGYSNIKVGSHHWNYPDLAIVRQQLKIANIKNNTVTVKSPLLIHIVPEYKVRLVQWDHLEEVGFQHFKITFPYAPRIAHHVEQGYNAIYLTRVFNSWVKDVLIENADSGILTESMANVTIENVKTIGDKKAHYTVQMGGVHNILVKNLKVHNVAEHPLSFNTFSTKCVYTGCEVLHDPILDQHSGANHQNLFDSISVYVEPLDDGSYPLFTGGGAPYWKPSHGSYSTFWNIKVHFLSQLDKTDSILLNGMNDGANAILMGISANKKIKIAYGPNAYMNFLNKRLETIPSLYQYQLTKRIQKL